MATREDGQQAYEGQGNAASSSSSFALPSRKVFLTTLASVAFVSGVGIAAAVTIRRGRRAQMEELRAAAVEASTASTAESIPRRGARQISQHDLPPPPPSQLEVASPQGPFALFREMNRAAFAGKGAKTTGTGNASNSDAPLALQRRQQPIARGKAIGQSIFDSSASAPPPSVLMRASKQSPQQQQPQVSDPQSGSTILQATGKEEAAASTSLLQQLRSISFSKDSADGDTTVDNGEPPVILAIKAFAIATALVGLGAWVAIEVACRVLGVSDMDELVERLTEIVPASERHNLDSPTWGEQIGQTARRHLGGWTGKYSDLDSATAMTDNELRQARLGHHHDDEPLPVKDVLAQLEDAMQRGDASDWMTILSRQLNAERRLDLQERQQRMAARLQAADNYRAS